MKIRKGERRTGESDGGTRRGWFRRIRESVSGELGRAVDAVRLTPAWHEEACSSGTIACAIDAEMRKRQGRTTILVVAGLVNAVLAVGLVGYYFQSIPAAALVLFVLLLWMIGAYAYFGESVLARTRAREPTPKESARIGPLVRPLAAKMGIPTPTIKVIDDKAGNAFAVGSRPDSGTIVFTTGLLKKMDDLELQGIAAHELAHLAQGDSRVAAISAGLLGWAVAGAMITGVMAVFLLTTGMLMLRGLIGLWGLLLGPLLVVAGAVVFVIGQAWAMIALLTHLGTHRQREWLADALAAQTTQRPLALAHALETLERQRRPLTRGRRVAQAVCFVGEKRTGSWWQDVLSTHPLTEDRIARLYEYAGRTNPRRRPLQ